jgi:hypothetical protein
MAAKALLPVQVILPGLCNAAPYLFLPENAAAFKAPYERAVQE